MLVCVEYEYEAGGYPMPLYTGSGTLYLNCEPKATDEEIVAIACPRIRRESIRRDGLQIGWMQVRNVIREEETV